ncbi:SpoIIE family protein phosphatase [Clostridium oryzae]|uniref:Phosphoserine phosphatase RsbU n=1 Tax=Clostridium oryzae TaxID=1450648 RepID=A0A1V4ILS4_9CLOT|nr:SpoIIE family protein phosphatase [Clostridium oryzae]OPJ60770.1 phosphoserine phosphatase RsbU [Clostridium oryzae]
MQNIKILDSMSYDTSLNNPSTLFKIFNAIPDVIKIYKPNRTIVFFNEAACDFYNKQQEEVYDKKCFEILDNMDHCDGCPFEEVLASRKMVYIERYYPNANKYMNVCYTPVCSTYGEVEFVVERMTDITESRTSSNLLKRDEKMYRDILNAYPDGIVIIQDNKLALANNEINKMIDLSILDEKDRSIFYCMPEESRKNATKMIRNILKNKSKKVIRSYNYYNSKNEKSNLQISLSYIVYKGKDAVLAIIRDETELRKSLNMATDIQNSSLQKEFPLRDKADVECLYYPANTVSGDYFKMYKISEELVVGVLVDVSGKGVTAALNISAFDVLFLQEILTNHDPEIIINNLNSKYNEYNQSFIAACCFSFNFTTKEAIVVGAGINEFLVKKADATVNEMEVKGPFIGMFTDSLFDKKSIRFESGDEFYFLTDGLDFIFNDGRVIQTQLEKLNMKNFKKYMDKHLNDMILENGSLKDDSSMLAIKIK